MSDTKSPIEEKANDMPLHTTQTPSDDMSDFQVPVIDLNHNESGKIVNPLAGLSRAKLFANVEAFAQEKELTEHTDLLKRGALVAQNGNGFDSIDLLSQDEKEAIHYELTHKWSHPLTLYFTIVTCSIGAAVCTILCV